MFFLVLTRPNLCLGNWPIKFVPLPPCLSQLLHGTVVDTSVSFPHRLGLPHKMTLHNLTADYLRRIIQESGGSNTNKSGSGEDVYLLCVIKVCFLYRQTDHGGIRETCCMNVLNEKYFTIPILSIHYIF